MFGRDINSAFLDFSCAVQTTWPYFQGVDVLGVKAAGETLEKLRVRDAESLKASL